MKRAVVCVLILGAILLGQPAAWADGMLMGKKGLLIESSQSAFIEWRDGQERLYVGTTTKLDQVEPSLWLLPVPAAPGQVKAEPMLGMPRVYGNRSLVKEAKENLLAGIVIATALDTALMPLVFIGFIGVQASTTFSDVGSVLGGVGAPGIVVHEHIEKLGMTIEIISAESTSALDGYLKAKELPFNAKNLPTLAPYLKAGNVLVCAWSSKGMAARAMRLDFPSPKIYFPLRPSQVYKTPIHTVLHVQGLAQRPTGTAAGLFEVEYQLGRLTSNERDPLLAFTRVEVNPNPATWNEDLLLEPGGPVVIHLANFFARLPLLVVWLLVTLLGGLVAWWLPAKMAGGGPVTTEDRAWAVLVGLGTGFSIIMVYFLLRVWTEKKPYPPGGDPTKRPWRPLSATVVLAFLHLLVCLAVFGIPYVWLSISEPSVQAAATVAFKP